MNRSLENRRRLLAGLLLGVWLGTPTGTTHAASDHDEFEVKREQVFEFVQKPRVARAGDKVTIEFETKGFCDVTVAIEDEDGRIVRHLASGVLGLNAPAPFKKNSKRQTLVWDGKNDKGEYVDDKHRLAIRVALGLKPRFERTLFWSPKKRVGSTSPVIAPGPKAVYVYEGYAVDHVRLFDHDGNHVRTVYPFPGDKVEKVVGLGWHTFAQDGRRLPLKRGYHQATLLTSGTNNGLAGSGEGFGATAMTVRDDRLALTYVRLNRLATDGTSGGARLEGPTTAYTVKRYRVAAKGRPLYVGPRSAAFSPDGKWLYLTGFGWHHGWPKGHEWLHGVTRLAYDRNYGPKVFAGSVKPGEKGTDNAHFNVPTSVAVDAKGRVYVSDYMNERVQIFDPDGRFLKSLPVAKPTQVAVHHRTGEISVFSWLLHNQSIMHYEAEGRTIPATLTHFGPFERPKTIATYVLPLRDYYNRINNWSKIGGFQHRAALDTYTDPPTVWVVPAEPRDNDASYGKASLLLFTPKDGKLVVKRDFGKDARRGVVRVIPPILWRQRLYVSPANGRLYVAEGDSGVMKSVNQGLVEIDAQTGRVRLVDLAMGAEDLCFGIDGTAYLRTDTVVARYDPNTWKEIPWDYGEERRNHSFGMGARGASLVAGLPTPGRRSNPFWHLGGMDVSAKGHIVVTSCNLAPKDVRTPTHEGKARFTNLVKPYTPTLYPGRARWGEVHVWDQRGRFLFEDVVPGMMHMNGIGIDEHDNLYMMAAARRLVGGKGLDSALGDDVSCTLVKVRPGRAKVLSTSSRIPIRLAPGKRPTRPPDITSRWTGQAWIEGAEWFYGGVGFNPPGCVCWNCRFDLDQFARSFAPEPLHYSVAVLDANGNLILRMGRYGNADDGMPLVRKGGPPRPRSIGGDEVALFHACYVATHTDRRLFIADAGNARIVSVRLGYHATERVALKDVPDRARTAHGRPRRWAPRTVEGRASTSTKGEEDR